MRIHDVIRTTAHILERRGKPVSVPHLMNQFPDFEIGDDRNKWNMEERIVDAFLAQEKEYASLSPAPVDWKHLCELSEEENASLRQALKAARGRPNGGVYPEKKG
jgi:hypothetical protein